MNTTIMMIPCGFKIRKKADIENFVNKCMQKQNRYDIMVDDVKKNLEKFDRIMYWESNIFGDKEVCDHFFEMMNYE